MSNSSFSSGGIGCITVLGLIFIGLKLAEIGVVATWSWWWVFSPFIFQFVIIGIAFFGFLVWYLFSKK